MLEVKNVSKVFLKNTPDEVVALSGINLSIKTGDFVTVIGSNGAGKSSLLNAIMGFTSLDSGSIHLHAKDITNAPTHERAKEIGRIAQDTRSSVCADMSIEENLAMAALRGRRRGLGIAVKARNRAEFQEKLRELGLGLEERLSTKVGTLSGGQRQALALLMATMTHPKLLLLDEHIAALDPKRAEQVMQLTHQAIAKHQLTTLMVTHNMAEAIRWGERLIMMHKGRVVFEASGETKRSLSVADLVDKFHEVSAEEFAIDRMLLAV
ncbi:MAG: ATP-binding cassette domain-containing protein [Anaerolineae bacterium]